MSRRLTEQPLEWLDRTQSVEIEFEGHKYQGFKGDTVSSLLLANGVSTLGRSFKYHRRRSVFSFANHDVNALVESAATTNIRADMTPVVDGMALKATNTLGGLAKDRRRHLGKFSKFLPVGFYYKAFFKPRWLFPYWENIIRRAAGLGKVDLSWPAARVPKRYGFCDVLVIGAGPAGLAAALAAAEAGARVALVDENSQLGGSLDYQHANNAELQVLARQLKQDVTAHADIEIFLNSEASGFYQDNWVPITTRNGIVKMRSQQVIAATGLQEQPAVFHNNDLPGVMLASAAQRLVSRYAVKPAESVVMLVANQEGYRAALDMMAAGVKVVAVVDLNAEGVSVAGELAAEVAQHTNVFYQHAVYAADSREGHLSEVTVCPLDDNGECLSSTATVLACDGLLMSVGWAPSTQLLYQAGAKIKYDEQLEQLVPVELPAGVHAAGRVNGVFDIKAQIADGQSQGSKAAGETLSNANDVVDKGYRASEKHSHPYPIFSHPKGKNFVDMDEDLQLNDLINAASEGFDNIELIKRYSTIGMGPSQGKHANMNGIRILARIKQQGIDETGSTTARPMYHPVPMNMLAGRRFRPERRTPLHGYHKQHNAVMMEAGAWLRPEYYASAGDRVECIQAEANRVRSAVGLIDVSTLGKIEAFGPDVAELMNRLFTMRMDNLKIGMTRYALMVDESGVIIDDGVAARYADDHYYFSTTSGTSDSAYRMIQRYIVEWRLDVTVVNRTGQLAAMNLAGPQSRSLLEPLCDLDLSEEGFPYLAARRGTVLGKPATFLRVGFVGELGYEIHLRASDALAVWQGLMDAGEELGIGPFGVEAQRLLRLEKGHIIIGQDTDGLTNPYHADMKWAVHAKKEFFIGQRSLQIVKEMYERKLFGFVLPGTETGPVKECHLLIEDGDINGRVTSISYSPAVNETIGLAYVENPAAKVGDEVQIRVDSGKLVSAELVALPFYDPEGLRQSADIAASITDNLSSEASV